MKKRNLVASGIKIGKRSLENDLRLEKWIKKLPIKSSPELIDEVICESDWWNYIIWVEGSGFNFFGRK